jgi:hypothetical protein
VNPPGKYIPYVIEARSDPLMALMVSLTLAFVVIGRALNDASISILA